MTHSLFLILQFMKLLNTYLLLAAKIPLVVTELVIEYFRFFFPYIVQYLTVGYNLCIKHDCFPSNLKTAKVIPLTKAKDLTYINTYRPFKDLSSLSKPLYKHIQRHLLKYLEKFSLIHEHQSGFRPKNSCQTALICFVGRLLSAVNDSDLTGVVFLDLKKTFDLVDDRFD